MTRSLHLRPGQAWWNVPLKDLWEYRHLLSFFTWRDIKVRYKQTFVGVLWVIMQPFLEMVVLAVIFGDLYRQTDTHIPYPLFVYAGLLPWTYFASAVNSSTGSIIANADIVKRIYFPRIMVPIATALSKLLDFTMSFLILLGLMAYYQYPVHASILLVPVLLFLLLLATSAIALWLSILNTLYRDVALIVPYFVRIAFFLTPVIYPVESIGPRWQWLLLLNPLTGIIESFRSVLLEGGSISLSLLGPSIGVIILLFFGGLWFFYKLENTMLDTL